MSSLEFETYDVFTDEKFSGNQLAVVRDATGLTTEQMLAITREFNLSETTFILPPENPDHTARVRIFTLGYEMPFAGHPTVGTSVSIARARDLSGSLLLELNAGLFKVDVSTTATGGYAVFENPNLPVEIDDVPGNADFEKALSLPAGSIETGQHRPRRIGAGVDYFYAKASYDDVRRAKINSAAWGAISRDGLVGLYLYADGGEAEDATYHARMFAPDAGIPEDPATGSAAAAFPGQIIASDYPGDGDHRWVIEQGFEMGRPSRIKADVTTSEGAITRVRIGGDAVHVQSGRLYL